MKSFSRYIVIRSLIGYQKLKGECKYSQISIINNNKYQLGFCDDDLNPLSHQTSMPQRLYSVLKPCQLAVGSPLNTPLISNLPVIACTQRPHSVPTASTRRSNSVFTASMTFLQRASSCCSVFTARPRRTQRPHGDYSV